MPTLTWQRADGGSQVFRADGPEISIGRDPGNSVHMDSTFVSRRHAVIRGAGKAFTITDLGSANGTFLNGARVQSAPLAQGDTIKLGSEAMVFAVNGGSGSSRVRLAIIGMMGLLCVVLVAALFLAPATEPDESGDPTAAEVGQQAPADQRPVAAEAAPGTGLGTPATAPAPTAQGTTVGVAPPAPRDGAGAPAAQPAAVPPTSASVPGNGEALYDAALAHIKGDRLIEARRLLMEAIQVGPENPSAHQRLREVEATIQARIEQHLVAGQQQVSYLRFREAILEWEQVVAITEDTDPRHQQALEAIERARLRLGGR